MDLRMVSWYVSWSLSFLVTMRFIPFFSISNIDIISKLLHLGYWPILFGLQRDMNNLMKLFSGAGFRRLVMFWGLEIKACKMPSVIYFHWLLQSCMFMFSLFQESYMDGWTTCATTPMRCTYAMPLLDTYIMMLAAHKLHSQHLLASLCWLLQCRLDYGNLVRKWGGELWSST
jgi:hypothetical protein